MTPELTDHQLELQRLRAQLLEAERTAVRAQQAATEFHDQLTEAQADIANMKARWYAAEKARNAVSSARQVDTSGLSAHVAVVEKERDRALQSARTETEKAAGRVRIAEQRLAETAATLAQTEASAFRCRRRSTIFFFGCIALSVSWAGTVVYSLLPPARPSIKASVSEKASVPKARPSALPQELGRLDTALQRFPSQDREAVMRQVHSKHPSSAADAVCDFDWSNGQPTITYGAKANWAQTISRCADAVEQAH